MSEKDRHPIPDAVANENGQYWYWKWKDKCAEVERLKVEIKGLRDELERYNPPSALRPPAGWVPMLSDNGHYWGCPTQTGGKCDCGGAK